MMQLFIFIFISALLFLLIVQISSIGTQAQTQPSVSNPNGQHFEVLIFGSNGQKIDNSQALTSPMNNKISA